MFCRHVYNKLDENMVQSCEKCGKSRSVSCSHKWTEYKEFKVMDMVTEKVSSFVYIRECSVCGELKQFAF